MVPITPPREYKNDIQIDDPQCRGLTDNSEQDKHVGNDHRGKQLEKIFDPKMHDPKAPEVIDYETFMRAYKQPYGVEGGNRESSIKQPMACCQSVARARSRSARETG